jgi:5-methylcytosine-specific restriction endonuclease McrA
MPHQTIPLQLPEAIYQRLQQVAHATHHSIEEVVLQTIRGNLPPSLDDLSPEWHGAVADLQQMSDEALWLVTKASLPPHQWRRHQHLLRKGQEGPLSTAEREELAALRAATDRLVTRRSYTLALLKWRGHTIATDM